jgi:hypothetical protein
MKKGSKARLDDTSHTSHTSHTSLVVRQEVRTPCDKYNSNTDSLRTVSWIEIEVVSKSDGTQQCERVIMPSTARYIVVHYTVAETGPFSVFGLRLYPCSAI